MDEMLALLDGHQPCMYAIQAVFLNRMPDAIRLQLADADFADPLKVAEQADELWQSMSLSSYSTVHKVAWPRRQVRVKPADSANETNNNNANWCFYQKVEEVLKNLHVCGKRPGRPL